MNWSGGLVEWVKDETAHLSVVFSWNMPQAFQRAAWYKAQGHDVVVGGPAAYYRPNYFNGVATVDNSNSEQVFRHNPDATFTSRGCIRNCEFCIVPHSEGKLVELRDWPIRPIICDNNFLATSNDHFNSVIDKLLILSDVDFNQGLDTRLITNERAERLAELSMKWVRLAWDHKGLEKQFMRAFELLNNAGIKPYKIRVYCLIGWHDTPDDALYRLQKIKDLGARPNPMRFQPLNSDRRNQFVGPQWSEAELKNYMRYWSRQNWLYKIPFEEYRI